MTRIDWNNLRLGLGQRLEGTVLIDPPYVSQDYSKIKLANVYGMYHGASGF